MCAHVRTKHTSKECIWRDDQHGLAPARASTCSRTWSCTKGTPGCAHLRAQCHRQHEHPEVPWCARKLWVGWRWWGSPRGKFPREWGWDMALMGHPGTPHEKARFTGSETGPLSLSPCLLRKLLDSRCTHDGDADTVWRGFGERRIVLACACAHTHWQKVVYNTPTTPN